MPREDSDRRSRRKRVFETRFCERCQCDREFSGRKIAHGWHLGLTVVTLGLWGVGWLALVLGARRMPWRCSACHSRFVPTTKRNPQWSQPTVAKSRLPIEPRQSMKPKSRDEGEF